MKAKKCHPIILREIDFGEKAQTVKLNFGLKHVFRELLKKFEAPTEEYNSPYSEDNSLNDFIDYITKLISR